MFWGGILLIKEQGKCIEGCRDNEIALRGAECFIYFYHKGALRSIKIKMFTAYHSITLTVLTKSCKKCSS